MLFNSVEFLFFFPIVVLIYFIIPDKTKKIWLLFTSYYFYMSWNAKYALLLLLSTLVTYSAGILIEKVKNANFDIKKTTLLKKSIVAGSCVVNLGILLYFKYGNFALSTITSIFSLFNIQLDIPQFDILLPVGISFYTFQSLGYTIDVYRDQIKAERNIITYALFVSFFPQIAAGPIGRAKHLMSQIAAPHKFNFENARDGLLLMLWGFFLKIVLADRLATFIDTIYNDHMTYGGYYLIVATLLLAIQIYCDFYGYSVIAMGTAKIIGITLTENFQAPYLATSVAEFWRNWHISLTSWFKDYLYIPLGGSRKGTLRKHLNKIIVFLVSGLWHGASFSFVIWGGLNGIYQVIGEILQPLKNKLVQLFKLNTESFSHKLLKITTTYLLIDFSWIFFRANSVQNAFEIINQMFTVYNPWILFDGSLYTCGLDQKNFGVVIFALLVLLFADICKKKNISIRNFLMKQDYWFRWLVLAISIFLIIIYGIWGPSYDATNFIYFQF